MKKLLLASVVVILIAGAWGCASSSATAKKGLPDTSMKNWPKWYLDPLPEEPGHIFAKATETSLKAELAENKATTEARKKIAQTIEIKVQNLEKKFDEEIGLGEDAELNSFYSSTTKTLTSQMLNGTRVAKTDFIREGTIFRAFVMVVMDDEFAKGFVERVKNNKQLYQRFRASKAFEEMEKEIKEYEEWKEKNK